MSVSPSSGVPGPEPRFPWWPWMPPRVRDMLADFFPRRRPQEAPPSDTATFPQHLRLYPRKQRRQPFEFPCPHARAPYEPQLGLWAPTREGILKRRWLMWLVYRLGFTLTPMLLFLFLPLPWYFRALLALWWLVLAEFPRWRGRRMAAYYLADIFDLRQRGTPLYRKRQEAQKDKDKHAQESLPFLNPRAVAEQFLEERVFGRNGKRYFLDIPFIGRVMWIVANGIDALPPLAWLLNYSPLRHAAQPPIALRKNQQLDDRHPRIQQALWLGGIHWWFLDEYTGVVLDHPKTRAFRALIGPTFGQKPRLQSLPISEEEDEDFVIPGERILSEEYGEIQPRLIPAVNEQLEKAVPQAFFNRGFEQVHLTLEFGTYEYQTKTTWYRTRDGIRVEIRNLKVTAEFVPYPYKRLLKVLCLLLHRDQPVRLGAPWHEDWLAHLDSRFLLQREMRRAVSSALAHFVRSHTLEQLMAAFYPAAQIDKDLLRGKRELRQLSKMRRHREASPTAPLKPATFEEFKAQLRRRLENAGFRLLAVEGPYWHIPERLEQVHDALLRDIARIRRWREALRAQYWDEMGLNWILTQLQRVTTLSRKLDEYPLQPPNENLVKDILATLGAPLLEGLRRWQQEEHSWYPDIRDVQRNMDEATDLLKSKAPYPTKEEFDEALNILNGFVSLWRMKLHTRP